MNATSADGMPTSPQLGSTPGFVLRGQNASPTQTHISINGSRTDRYTLTVDWALEAKRVGTLTIGPPSVVVGGSRYAGRAIPVHVVPAGQAPRRTQPQPPPSPFGFSPFDPWRGLIPGIPGIDRNDQEPAPPQVTTDPKLSLDAPRAPIYFLHATVDKTSCVVGEQLVFSVYEYIDAATASVEVDEEDVHDAQVGDFVKRPLLREDQEAVLAGYASIAGRTWVVKLVRRWALFPLRTGDLVIGPMSVSLARPRTAAGGQRATETLHVRVIDPPLAGRPPGFAVGDVGKFTLSAQVQPRDVEQGGAVGVHVELSGTGNVPSAIATPVREGIEWLAPETHEALGPIGHDAYGGNRSLDFVVRVKRSGEVDLGELSLPFWDPDAKKYAVARAPLGIVRVKATSVGADDSSSVAREVLPGLPGPRDVLEATKPRGHHADDSILFWIVGVGAWPLAFGLTIGGRAVGWRVVRAWRSRRSSPEANLRARLALARVACGGMDARGADAAIARALEAATIAHAGVSVRDAVGGEIIERLERAGIARPTAASFAELLRECEAARFAPESADVVAARERWIRAQGAIRQLEKRG
jgi:hypothetical protein